MGHRDPRKGSTARVGFAVAAGLVAGAALVAGLLACGENHATGVFVEKEQFRPQATDAEIAEWTAQWEKRAKPWANVPDPPGEGPVVSERYWLSRAVYEMEVRRRGRRLVVEIHGVDTQTMGGGWSAFGEGTITGDPKSFGGAEARISWSCLGIRFRAASDGLARLSFSPDGLKVTAVYLAHEAMGAAAPDAIAKAYGERATGPRPPHGTYRGQIPYRDASLRHPDSAVVKVTGRVTTPDGEPVPGAVVQLKGKNSTRTESGDDGRFAFEFLGRDAPWAQAISAGALGYRNGETALFTGDATHDVVVEMTPLDLSDHVEYRWQQPNPLKDADDVMSCGTCHTWQYTEWLGSRHARMADHGHVAWERARMLEAKAAAPDDCAGCHQPGEASVTGRGGYTPLGVLASNHCDFCHKVYRTTDVGKPGVLGSLDLARPDPKALDRPGAVHRVFGGAPDVSYAYMGASYDPYFVTSWLCAGCHQGGGLPGRPKVDTFEEWRAWARKGERDPAKECQDCHMPTAVTTTVEDKPIDLFAWETFHRRPGNVHSHAFPGATKDMAAKALDVKIEKSLDREASAWVVKVTITNVGAGHKVPTGTWTKHVAVEVRANGGEWRAPPGSLFGVFAKGSAAPADFWSPPAPAAPGVVEDTRLGPGESRTIETRFPDTPPPGGGFGKGEPTIEVRVLHRRGAFGATVKDTPWEIHPSDPAPEVEWMRVVK